MVAPFTTMEHLDAEMAQRLLRGQLDARAQALWERHVEGCARCRALLADEREWLGLVNLGQGAPPAAGLASACLVQRVQQAVPRPTARRPSAWLLGGELVALAVLSLALIWQVARAGAVDDPSQAPTVVSIALEAKAAANLDALTALAQDPWLADQYEDVEMLGRFIAGQEQ